MYAKFLENFIVKENVGIYETCWRFYRSGGKILIVVDEEEKYMGIVTESDI